MDKTVIKGWKALARASAPNSSAPLVSEESEMLEALICDDDVRAIVLSDPGAVKLIRAGMGIQSGDAYGCFLLGKAAETYKLKLRKAATQAIANLSASEVQLGRHRLTMRARKRKPVPCDPP